MLLELDILDANAQQDPNNPDLNETRSKREFWRSAAHLEQSAQYQEFIKGEFQPGAMDHSDLATTSSRRKFLQLMGASASLMGLAACRKPFEKVLPYTRQPEEIIPGKPLFYASAMPFAGFVRPVLVESHEGRPTKVEGNPDHPASFGVGATGLFEQATILNMFDPERTRLPKKEGKSSNWSAFVREVAAGAVGKRIAVLAPSLYSPTMAAQKAALEAKGGKWYTFDAAGDDFEALGLQLAFGRALRPVYNFSQANVIVSLDADFLASTDKNIVHNTREFAQSRKVRSVADDMSRLYVVESAFTTTGGMADNRKKLRSSDVPAFTAALAAEFGIGDAGKAGKWAGDKWVKAVADDLKAHPGKGIVLAGANQPPVVHALAALLNQANGSLGTAVQLYDHPQGTTLVPQAEQLKALAADLNAGNVDVLLMLNTNPVYNGPSDLNFAAAIKKAGVSISAAFLRDETAQASTWYLPLSHFLEAWGDGLSYTGVKSIIQPLIAPLYESRSDIEIVNMLLTGAEKSGYDLVRANNAGINWEKSLNDGFVAGTGLTPTTAAGSLPAGAMDGIKQVDDKTIEVVFRPHLSIYDGTYSNNAWMHELPEMITKIVWDSVAVMSPETIKKLGLSVDISAGNYYVDVVNLKVNDRVVAIPVWAVPGYADNSIGVSLGYGRKLESDNTTWSHDFFSKEVGIYQNGPIANSIGSSIELLRTSDTMSVALHAEVSKASGDYQIVTTQDHGALDWDPRGGIESQQDRKIIRMETLEEYKKKPRFAKDYEHKVDGEEVDWSKYPSLWENDRPFITEEITKDPWHKYQWGMVIDLNMCTGCSSCVTACQSENNIAVVGKEQVGRGRELAWVRLDRYFYGSEEEPGMVMQPMICQHCENAPCEQVCPINATSHSPDGINEMTYNRCVGTRYCANNCPYKVRRYNFLNWTKDLPKTVQMAHNPDVTVRFRGVMEKCTFCVQRIREAGIDARREGRTLKDQEVLTACQQVCPAQAITFGNIADSTSEVAKLKKNERNYEILAELANRPRTSYFARLRNPNPALTAPHYRNGAHHGGEAHGSHGEHA